MMRSANRPVSPIDYAEYLRGELPADRGPYILARLAFNNVSRGGDPTPVDYAVRAVYEADVSGVLNPRLGETALKSEVYAMVEDFDRMKLEYPRIDFPVAAAQVLLAWVIDHGNTHHAAGELNG